jgi:hypothetical protein
MKDMNITFQLSDRDRELIANLITKLDTFIETNKTKETNTQPEPSQPERTQPEHPAPDTSHIEPEPEAPVPQETPEKPLTMDDVPSIDELRYKVVQLVSQGKKEAVKAIVNEYAPSVGEVPANKRIECMERLQGLEG